MLNKSILTLTLIYIILAWWNSKCSANNNPPNVLFIIADDLRPTLGCYQMLDRAKNNSNQDILFHTPNIDRLAKQSIMFTNAFAQEALCGPSRTSFLTSRRPFTLKVYSNRGQRYFRRTANFTTMPQWLRRHGYRTVSVGKIFHPGRLSGGNDDFPISWSEPPYHPSTEQYRQVCHSVVKGRQQTEGRRNLVCPVLVDSQPEATLPDIQSADFAVDFLRNYGNRSAKTTHRKPFFLAVGFHKPHIPLKFPENYTQLYPLNNISLADNHRIPRELPEVAWNPWQDLRNRDDVKQLTVSFPYGPLPHFYQKLVRQAYYSSVSFMDAQLGRILDELYKSDFDNNTVIVFTSDHGWSLGEHGEWAKYSNFGVATRVPLLVRPISDASNQRPSNQRSSNQRSSNQRPSNEQLSNERPSNERPSNEQLSNERPSNERPSNEQPSNQRLPIAATVIDDMVELLDVFPTVVAAVCLPSLAVCPRRARRSRRVRDCVEGRSLLPLRANARNGSSFRDRVRRSSVFFQFPRPSLLPQLNSDQPNYRDIRYMGYTVRTRRYRYTEWRRFRPGAHDSEYESLHSRKAVIARELYALDSDADENDNRADDPHLSVIQKKLRRRLKKHFI